MPKQLMTRAPYNIHVFMVTRWMLLLLAIGCLGGCGTAVGGKERRDTLQEVLVVSSRHTTLISETPPHLVTSPQMKKEFADILYTELPEPESIPREMSCLKLIEHVSGKRVVHLGNQTARDFAAMSYRELRDNLDKALTEEQKKHGNGLQVIDLVEWIVNACHGGLPGDPPDDFDIGNHPDLKGDYWLIWGASYYNDVILISPIAVQKVWWPGQSE